MAKCSNFPEWLREKLESYFNNNRGRDESALDKAYIYVSESTKYFSQECGTFEQLSAIKRIKKEYKMRLLKEYRELENEIIGRNFAGSGDKLSIFVRFLERVGELRTSTRRKASLESLISFAKSFVSEGGVTESSGPFPPGGFARLNPGGISGRGHRRQAPSLDLGDFARGGGGRSLAEMTVRAKEAESLRRTAENLAGLNEALEAQTEALRAELGVLSLDLAEARRQVELEQRKTGLWRDRVRVLETKNEKLLGDLAGQRPSETKVPRLTPQRRATEPATDHRGLLSPKKSLKLPLQNLKFSPPKPQVEDQTTSPGQSETPGLEESFRDSARRLLSTKSDSLDVLRLARLRRLISDVGQGNFLKKKPQNTEDVFLAGSLQESSFMRGLLKSKRLDPELQSKKSERGLEKINFL